MMSITKIGPTAWLETRRNLQNECLKRRVEFAHRMIEEALERYALGMSFTPHTIEECRQIAEPLLNSGFDVEYVCEPCGGTFIYWRPASDLVSELSISPSVRNYCAKIESNPDQYLPIRLDKYMEDVE